MDAITEFKGQYAFLSNFYPHPISYGGVIWKTSEHAYQAAKTLDSDEVFRIFNAETPGKAKRLGREVTLRPGWHDTKIDVMFRVLEAKFSNKVLWEWLDSTGDAKLVEGNYHGDDFWGVNLETGVGKNHLGKMLMRLREEKRVFG